MRSLLLLLTVGAAVAADFRGVVRFGGLPLPGASVTATCGTHTASTVTDAAGAYTLAEPASGRCTLEVSMQMFAPQRRDATAEPMEWDLKLAPVEVKVSAPATPFRRTEVAAAKEAPKPAPPPQDPSTVAEMTQRAADGLLVNGSVNNGAASIFAQLPAFGNNRRGQRSRYNGNFGFILNNSTFDARSYSLTGQDTPKPAYSRLQGLLALGGPMIRRNWPMFTVNYQWTRNSNGNTLTGLMPTAAERAGDLSSLAAAVIDPLSGAPVPGNRIPASRLNQQAQNLLTLYPNPNFTGGGRYNFQAPIVRGEHQDDLQARVNKMARRNFYSASVAWQNTRTDTPDLFGFLDTGRNNGINLQASYRRSFSARTFITTGIQFSRQTTRVTPFFSGRRNVSAEAGITGNNQESVNWGPPNLQFSGGLSSLNSAQSSLVRNQTSGVSTDLFMSRGRHNIMAGAVYRRQQFNVLSQQDARGTFAFTGAAAGSDLAGFLFGVPDTSTIAYGNADKYLRGSIQEAYINDDYRVNPSLTLNLGVRWEYWSPLSEKYGRLANLGQPSLQPDRNNISPRLAFSWRPLPASSIVVRGGYGVYYDTSVYQPITLLMAQQPPLSRNLRVSNSAATPLSLAAGFGAGLASAPTFGVDPHFRVGYSQNWQLSVQRDFAAGLQVVANYQGGKGTRGQQQVLPFTYPDRAEPSAGYTYLLSNGNSIRHAGQLQVRRRLRKGFTAAVNYTWAKSLDNAALGGRSSGGALTAQNWLDLRAERARSNFDQRHAWTASAQYTSSLARRRVAFRDWTLGAQLTAGTGLPLTPVYPVAVPGTGVTGVLRPDFTGLPLYDAPAGLHLNPAALAVPATGRWGNAGRNSITGPRQFVLGSSLSRTFRGGERVSMDFRLEAANVLNHPTYPSWNAVLGNSQFGLPMAANPMRTVQAAFRTRF